MNNYDKEFKIFLQEWWNWSNEAKEGGVFVRWAGLCHNLECWTIKNMGDLYISKMDSTLANYLNRDFGTACYPFGGQAVYDSEGAFDLGSAHLNQMRLSWVRKMIEELS